MSNEIHPTAVLGNNIQLGDNVKQEPYVVIRDNVVIGNNVWIKEFVCIYSGARIGSNVKIRKGCVICEDAIIGNNVEFGCNVDLVNHVKLCAFTGEEDVVIPPIIEDGVRIGGKTTIQAGVRVGKNAVILPHSQVRQNVPEGEMWGGNPAKFFKKVTN